MTSLITHSGVSIDIEKNNYLKIQLLFLKTYLINLKNGGHFRNHSEAIHRSSNRGNSQTESEQKA
jgi:hypothetical protein